MLLNNHGFSSCLVNAVIILKLQGTDSFLFFLVYRYLPRLGAKLKQSGAAYSAASWS